MSTFDAEPPSTSPVFDNLDPWLFLRGEFLSGLLLTPLPLTGSLFSETGACVAVAVKLVEPYI